MEDFDNYFTVEVYMSKGWEVVGKHETFAQASDHYRREFQAGPEAVRLTSPMNK